ncbi:hypothetical protein [Mycolicibacterium fortuitum]|uniref:hypothetical protein n=1 Tax=Mycolicibacterium fortuitum TaxID=1766 RepID=UPI003F64FB7E
MPGNRQRRSLDPPPQQALAEMMVKASQRVEIDGAVVQPGHLDDDVHTCRTVFGQQRFVRQREPIIRSHGIFARATARTTHQAHVPRRR